MKPTPNAESVAPNRVASWAISYLSSRVKGDPLESPNFYDSVRGHNWSLNSVSGLLTNTATRQEWYLNLTAKAFIDRVPLGAVTDVVLKNLANANELTENDYWAVRRKTTNLDVALQRRNWSLVPTGTGFYKIVNLETGTVLTPAGWEGKPGTRVVAWRDENNPNQLWTFKTRGHGCPVLSS